MALSFLSLLYLQVSYIEEMVRMRREQFEESVQRGLVQACKNIELVETKKYLEDDVATTERAAELSRQHAAADSTGEGTVVVQSHQYSIQTPDGINYRSTVELKQFQTGKSRLPKSLISTGKNIPQTSKALQEILRDR